MQTRTYIIHHPFKSILSPRPKGGFFIPGTSPKKIRAGLTKVNILVLILYKSISCEGRILQVVTLCSSIVNNFGQFLTSYCGITPLYYITPSTSTFLNYLCASGVKPDFCICGFRAWLVQKLGALYNPLLIFEFCFFT